MDTLPLELRMRSVGPWPMNTYALVCPDTRQSVLFDPGADPDMLAELLADSQPIAILLTHTHPDHIGALAAMRERLGVPVLAHPGPHVREIVQDGSIADGQEIALGTHRLRAIYTPGHTPDMISFAILGDHRVIVGDTVFAGGPGRTASAADFRTTLLTLQDIVLTWPDTTVCFPGHGPSFSIGEICPAVEAFLARDHGEFFGDATWDMA